MKSKWYCEYETESEGEDIYPRWTITDGSKTFYCYNSRNAEWLTVFLNTFPFIYKSGPSVNN